VYGTEHSQLDFKKGMNMKNIKFYLVGILIAASVYGCKDFVQGIDPPINIVKDNFLNDESQTDFIVKGVKAQFYDAYGQLSCLGDALADELVFDTHAPNATYQNYQQIDQGLPITNDNSIEDAELSLGRFRLYADTLLARAGKIVYKDSIKKNLAFFTGYFYGGIARYLYASYFGLKETEGGGCINLSPFIPSATMYDLALQKINASIPFGTEDQQRLAHTILARIELIKGDYSQAKADAALGMVASEPSFDAQYSSEAENFWWGNAGAGRVQFVLDPRFKKYLDDDPKESSRLMIVNTPSNDTAVTLYRQNKYPQDASPIPFATWQESELIEAEVAARAGDDASALTFVNDVRASHGLDPRTATNLDSIYIERDKELFCTGARLIDERRFGKWHLPSGWQYLPITQLERSANSNLH
jgi:hypothetical protein